MKNEIEKITTQIIQTAQKNKTFIDFAKIYNLHKTYNVKFFIIISIKGHAGKSTSGINWIVNNLKKDNNYTAAWIRNTETAAANSKLENSFKLAMLEAGFDMTHWVFNKGGIYYKEDLTNKLDKGICKVLFCYLNTYENFCSQNIMRATDIFYDEFIDPKFVMNKMSEGFEKLIKSIQRTTNAMIVMFANPHSNRNDIIVENGIVEEINWESGETQINYVKNLNTLICYITDYENINFTEADKETNKFFQYNESVQLFNKGILTNPINNVIPWHRLDNTKFDPLLRFHVRDNKEDISFVVGWIENKMIIKQLYTKEYENIQGYTVRAGDLIPNFIFIDEIDKSYIPLMINTYKANNLIFTNLFTEDIFKRIILPKLATLEIIRKRDYS